MSVKMALSAAGARVMAFQRFNDEQAWWAMVVMPTPNRSGHGGELRWIVGEIGDEAIPASDYHTHNGIRLHVRGDDVRSIKNGIVAGCLKCVSLKRQWAQTGQLYLDDSMDQPTAELIANDDGMIDALNFIRAVGIEYRMRERLPMAPQRPPGAPEDWEPSEV